MKIVILLIFFISSSLISQEWERAPGVPDEYYFGLYHFDGLSYCFQSNSSWQNNIISFYNSTNYGASWFLRGQTNYERPSSKSSQFDNSYLYFPLSKEGTLSKLNLSTLEIEDIELPSEQTLLYIEMNKKKEGIIGTILFSSFDLINEIFITKDDWQTHKKFNAELVRSVALKSNDEYTSYMYINYEDSTSSYFNKSTDYGETWEKVYLGDFEANRMFFLNENIGWISAFNFDFINERISSYLLKTTDGGSNWILIKEDIWVASSESMLKRINDIKFIDENIGIMTDLFDTIYYTFDGGETWSSENIPPITGDGKPVFRALTSLITPESILIAASNSGVFYKGVNIASVEESESPKQEVFPNPSHDLLNIDYNGSYSIYDLSGTKVSFGTSSGRIDISGLTPGVYFLETSNQERHKFVKQ